jgi:hypothetical protein
MTEKSHRGFMSQFSRMPGTLKAAIPQIPR